MGTLFDCNGTRLVAYCTERQFPAHMLGNGEIATMVTDGIQLLTLILYSDKAEAVTRHIVNDIAGNILLRRNTQRQQQ